VGPANDKSSERDLPAGWFREYEGRHGAEYFYDRRNLTVSVLPRYATLGGRASQKDPIGYVVRVHRLVAPEPAVPMTLGERETFPAARELAHRYMSRVDAVSLRSNDDGPFEAFAEVASYDDDTLVSLCRTLARSPVRSVVHADGDALDIAHATDETHASVRDRLGERVRTFAAVSDHGDDAWYVARRNGDLAWVPRGDASGTLVEFEDANDDVASFLAEIGRFVKRKDARRPD
jgi:hypothetical protein